MTKNSLKNLIVGDLRMWGVKIKDKPNFFSLLKHILYCLFFYPGFSCAFMYRLNHFLSKRFYILAKLFGVFRTYLFSSDISFRSEIGPGLKICHPFDIVVGHEAKIGSNFVVYNGVTIGGKYFDRLKEKPTIGDRVTVGTGSKLLGAINIGDDVIIGALTFCDRSVPSNSVAYGNPMIIKELDKL